MNTQLSVHTYDRTDARMRTYLIVLSALIALLFALAGTALAQAPRQISYQGALVSGSTPVSGVHHLNISLYDTALGGTPIYEESHLETVTNGIFNILIGSINPLPPTLTFDRQYFLGVSVDGDMELAPRPP